ncbi:hypothetical protein G7054_g15007 [Neopestalotiopsis clavispora]|nr:hypothetical protein G7054_g15007 [Neopestalotiopsis clavispora]
MVCKPINIHAILQTGKANVDSFQDGVTKLYKAAERHEFETMEILLKYGADVNKRCSLEEIRCCFDDTETVLELDEVSTRKGPTPLHAFAGRDKQEFIYDSDQETKRNAEKCFALLLKHGASVNETADGENHANMTPLHYAVRKDRDPTMFVAAGNINKFNQVLSKLLLDAGAELSARNGNQNTPLHIANPADPELVSFLIERGADIRAKNDAGRTPLLEMLRGLYWAKPNVRTMEVLSGHGQDCAATDNQGNNMFHYVFHELGKFTEEFIPIFRSALQGSGDAINKRNKNGQPPFLNYKSSSTSSYSQTPRGQEELLQEFIRGGMDLNVRDNRGQTILWRLMSEFEFPAKMEKFKLLTRLGADPKIHAGDGSTLLHAAQKWRLKTEWLHLLVSFGVNCLSCDANGNNLIHCFFANITNDRITEDNLHSFHTLIELGVPATANNRSGETVINILASVESCETFARSGWLSHVLQADVFRGLNVNESNDKGIAPIHSAAGCSEYNVQILLEAGADPTLLTDDGLSPLHIAAYKKQSNVVGLLLEWYQDHGLLDRYINLPDKSNGCTPLHYACRCRQIESIWYLLRYGADVRLRDKVGEDALTIIPALDRADYDVIKQYLPGVSGRLSVMDYSSGPVDMEDILKGRLDLLDHFACDIKDQELEPLPASDEDVPGTHTMLSRVSSRRHPSLHIIQALVDKSGLNATTINNAYASQTRLSRSIPVHKLAGGDYFWQVEALQYFLSHGVDTEAKTPQGDTLLVMALKSRGFWKEKVVRVLLKYKASSQAVESETGKNCLALSSSAALTKMLLAHGAKVENQAAILGSAITELDAVMARALLEAGADPNYIDEAAKTEWQAPESYELFVSPETQDRPVEFSNGRLRQFWDFREQQANEMNMARYALHDAARAVSKEVPPISWEQRRDDLVRVLLEKGADPWATYPNGDTVVHRVIHDKGLVAPLLDAPGCDINCRGQSGQTLLLSACRPVIAPCPLIPSSARLLPCPLVNTNAIHELLDRNVDVSMTDYSKRTALHLMLTLNRRFGDAHQKAFNALVERGGQKLVLARDSTDVSPLHLALASGQLEAVECLLVNGANVFSSDPRTGDTALHRVACRLVGESGAATEAAALWKHLIRLDLDVNARNHVGDTPALAYSRVNLNGTRDPKHRKSHPSYAMQHDTTHCAALALLVDSGADLMAVNYEGQGMLHLTAARRIGELDCEGRDQIKDVEDFFEKLLELGLDPRLEDRALRTPIDMAVARNRRGILQLFTPKGRKHWEGKSMNRAKKGCDDDEDKDGEN